MAALSTLTDLFDQATLNTGLWSQFTAGSATMTYGATGAQVNYPASSTASTDGDISTLTSYDLTGSGAYMQVLSVPAAITSANAEFRVYASGTNWFRWVYEAGSLFMQRNKAGVQATIGSSFTYNSTTHKYWRISESGGTVTYWTSPDGSSWTSQGTYVHGMTITAMSVLIAGTCFQAETSPGTFKWNNLNTIPAVGGNTNLFFYA